MSEAAPSAYDAALELARAGRWAEAAATLQAVLTADPDDAKSWSLMAALRQRLGQTAAVLACYTQLARLTPDDADVHLQRGNAQAALGHAAEALASFDRAVALAPALAFAHNNRANMLNRLDRPDEALAAADRALALDAGLVHAWRHRGLALACLGDPAGAVTAYERALSAAAPADRCDALSDMAWALASGGRYGEAAAALDEAVSLRPNDATALYRRAEIRLLTGDFASGWDDHEARWDLPEVRRNTREMTPELFARLLRNPRIEDLAGRRVLVVGEQGVGDVVMFASVLPDLAAIAAQVTCIVEPRLAGLLARSLPQVTFVAARSGGLDAGAFDGVVALGSLPFMFRRAAADFPGRPYLTPAPERVEAWRRRLDAAAAPGLRIGISWRGGSKRTRAVSRSMELGQLLGALDRDDRTFVSLQYGDVSDEVAAANVGRERPVLAFPPSEIDDFGDLAALIGALDVVVTVQTAAAHLAGALGAPGLVMIPRWPEWRYGLQGERIAWYGSLRLLRQTEAGDWSAVLADVDRRLDTQPK